MHFQSLLAFLSQVATFRYLLVTGDNVELEDPTLLSTVSFPYKNSEVVISTYSLPDSDEHEDEYHLEVSAATNVCGDECKQSCFKFPRKTPTQDDCSELAKWLKNQSGTIVIGKKKSKHASYGTCYTYFLNQSNKDYEYCYSDWATNVDALNDCLPKRNGAYCAQNSDSWGIELSGAQF